MGKITQAPYCIGVEMRFALISFGERDLYHILNI